MTGKRGPYAKTDARRREIIAAAVQVFSTSGYRAGSLKDIADLIGMDASSILHHFPSKDALLRAVLDDKERHDFQYLEEEPPDDPATIPDLMIGLAKKNEAVPGLIRLYAILSAESTTTDHPSGQYFRDRTGKARREFRRAFEQMAEAGLLAPGVTPEYAATSTLALWDGVQIHQLIDSAEVSVIDTLRAHLTIITRIVPTR